MWSLATPLAMFLLPLPLVLRRVLPPVPGGSMALYLPPGVAGMLDDSDGARRRDRVYRAMNAALWICLVIALAGPQRAGPSGVIPASGRDIVLAIDLSGSMEKEDFSLGGAPISRLEAVKRVAARFVASRRGDRVGLVLFGDRPYVAAPLTFDIDAVAEAIRGAAIGIPGRSTALSDGLGLAMKRVMRSDGETRVVVLLSDGIDTARRIDPREVASFAAENGIRIHTIALGPQDLGSAPAARDAVDAETLRIIAAASGGESFRVRTLEDLDAMAAALDTLEPNPALRPPLLVQRQYWTWPATLALGLACLLALRRRES
ncbi:VWA domain-containing protein [Limibaculum sp. M0105]|uniref:VWA domain-containing protein n=1 Tax=Thermohalobaculum xanthum TaxID=2753746 RepID=A0A8J7M5I9_9RHOB|nr:VWA domain-containing protein [Thermohalobaculum xanthum]MBK0398182.1 VWA domain-containing protein [Thermohalobaculum xanthum]